MLNRTPYNQPAVWTCPRSTKKFRSSCHTAFTLLLRSWPLHTSAQISKSVFHQLVTKSHIVVRAGLTTVPVVQWEPPPARGPRSTANFYQAVLTSERSETTSFVYGLNVTTTKIGRQLFGRRKVHPVRKSWLRV